MHFSLFSSLSLNVSHSSAATTTGPATPFQAAFNRLHTAPLEQGIVPFSPKAAFSQVKICPSPLSAYFNSFVVQADLEKLKSDASLTLNEAFFGHLLGYNKKGGEGLSNPYNVNDYFCSGFILVQIYQGHSY